ncbi:MAG: hypothetical protein J0I47_00510 [Sphingomonas sp.]|uniref:hypothetical protein n=1 Tax=Sphingomonas sp. TaxID=28214 RepID=UPI001AC11462|nr:hypothetical protein [Sphingomonas sp.]MBN8806710.1 hypothetical protein [Sphingomonas sp.]
MTIVRCMVGLMVATGLCAGTPASAQFFMKSYDFRGAPVTGLEPELGMTLPGATPAEVRAGLVWNLRAALNVAALQCDFAPSLLTVDHYNALLRDHGTELTGALNALTGYFTRVNKTKAAGQAAFDKFGTRTYSAFATVSAQYNFCQTASEVGRELIFAKRGEMGDVAVNYMRQMRNSLIPYGEQQFPRYMVVLPSSYPDTDPSCWKRDVYYPSECGRQGKKKKR